MTEVKTRYWCVFYVPGFMFSETSSLKVDSPDFKPAATDWPRNAFGYYINSQTYTVVDGVEYKGEFKQIGPSCYKGNIYNIDQVRESLARGETKFTRTCLQNLEYNKEFYDHVLECAQGMVQFDSRRDVLVT